MTQISPWLYLPWVLWLWPPINVRYSVLTLWRALLPYGYSYKHPVPDRVKPSFVIFDIQALWLAIQPWAPGSYTWPTVYKTQCLAVIESQVSIWDWHAGYIYSNNTVHTRITKTKKCEENSTSEVKTDKIRCRILLPSLKSTLVNLKSNDSRLLGLHKWQITDLSVPTVTGFWQSGFMNHRPAPLWLLQWLRCQV